MAGPAPLVVPALRRHTATVIFAHGLGDSGAGWYVAVLLRTGPLFDEYTKDGPCRKLAETRQIRRSSVCLSKRSDNSNYSGMYSCRLAEPLLTASCK